MPPVRVKIGHIVQIIGAKSGIKAPTPPTFAFYRMHTLRLSWRRSFALRVGWRVKNADWRVHFFAV